MVLVELKIRSAKFLNFVELISILTKIITMTITITTNIDIIRSLEMMSSSFALLKLNSQIIFQPYLMNMEFQGINLSHINLVIKWDPKVIIIFKSYNYYHKFITR